MIKVSSYCVKKRLARGTLPKNSIITGSMFLANLVYFATKQYQNYKMVVDGLIFIDTSSKNPMKIPKNITSKMQRSVHYNSCFYTIEEYNGMVDEIIVKKIIFSAQKIKTLKKLLYIPELFQNVYYGNKSKFISLRNKI